MLGTLKTDSLSGSLSGCIRPAVAALLSRRRVLRSLLSDVIAGRDVLEYCPSGLGDTHEATAVHYVFRRDDRRQYTEVVACRAGATAGDVVGRAPKLREA